MIIRYNRGCMSVRVRRLAAKKYSGLNLSVTFWEDVTSIGQYSQCTSSARSWLELFRACVLELSRPLDNQYEEIHVDIIFTYFRLLFFTLLHRTKIFTTSWKPLISIFLILISSSANIRKKVAGCSKFYFCLVIKKINI